MKIDISEITGVYLQYAHCNLIGLNSGRYDLKLRYLWLPKVDLTRIRRQLVYDGKPVPPLYKFFLNNAYLKPELDENRSDLCTLIALQPIFSEAGSTTKLSWQTSHPDITHFVGAESGKSLERSPDGFDTAERLEYVIGHKKIHLSSGGCLSYPFKVFPGQKIVSAFTGELFTLRYTMDRIQLLQTVERGFAIPGRFFGFGRPNPIYTHNL